MRPSLPDNHKIFFVRHAESQANAARVLAGGQDSPLTEMGIEQASQEASRIMLDGIKLDTIISSPQSRALETAKIIALKNNFSVDKIIVIDSLRERSGGSFEGGPIELYSAASDDELIDADVESFEDFALRVSTANKDITKRATGTTLVVGHSGFYRMSQALRDGLPPAGMLTVSSPSNGKLLPYPL